MAGDVCSVCGVPIGRHLFQAGPDSTKQHVNCHTPMVEELARFRQADAFQKTVANTQNEMLWSITERLRGVAAVARIALSLLAKADPEEAKRLKQRLEDALKAGAQ